MAASSPPLYFDNAATSHPKPESVYTAVDQYLRHSGRAAGRGGYRRGMEVNAAIDRARSLLARLWRIPDSSRVIFTKNATEGLNGVLHGVLQPGNHVVTTLLEHNSVRRPLHRLSQTRGVTVTTLAPDPQGRVTASDLRAALTPATRLIVLTHASNVTGAIQPLAEWGTIARELGIPMLLDAAQTAGHIPMDLSATPVDFVAAAGHKGLLGPLGTGVMYLRPGSESLLPAWIQGGTGTSSEDLQQPDSLPDKYEAGNLNVPGVIGLAAGLDYLLSRTVDDLRQHELERIRQFRDGIARIPEIIDHSPSPPEGQVGVISLNLQGVDPHTLATVLDQNYGIEVRAGLHCAPDAHRTCGSWEQGGSVRFSFSPFTTAEQIDFALTALKEIAAAF